MSFYGTTIRPGPGEPLVIAEEGRDPRSGNSITYEWRGREAEIRAMKAVQEGLNRRTSLRIPAFEGGEFILQATAGAGETEDKEQPLAIKWGLKKNFFEQNLWEHGSIKAVIDDVLTGAPFPPDEAKNEPDLYKAWALVRRDFEAFVRGEDKTTYNGEEVNLTSNQLAGRLFDAGIKNNDSRGTIFLEFLMTRLRGVEAAPEWGYVLQKTVTYADGTTQRPKKENVGRMFSVDSLKEAEGLDDQVIIGELPEGYWLKTPPEVERTAADKHEFVYEYWHAKTFEKFIYGEAV